MKGLSTIKLLGVALVLLCSAASLGAAEVRGRVSLNYEGLFQTGSSAQVKTVSVALLPAEDQRVVPRGVRNHRIEIVDNRMHPAFLTVQTGDRIEFTNRDGFFHQLFSLSPGEPLQARLEKATGKQHPQVRFTLDHAGTTHFFCRIHNKSYARIDVVDTSYLQTLQSGGEFRFVGLAAGHWRLRIAAPAAESRWIDVTAMTRPAMLDLVLTSHSGSVSGGGDFAASEKVQDLYAEPDIGGR